MEHLLTDALARTITRLFDIPFLLLFVRVIFGYFDLPSITWRQTWGVAILLALAG